MNLTWKLADHYTDGSVFGQADYAGVEVGIDAAPAVSLPAAWNPANDYSFPVDSLSLKEGKHSVALRVVATNGAKSDFSPAVEFNYKKTPAPPLAFGVV